MANGMTQMVTGICTVAGPLFGVIAVSILGMAWVFMANSVSYFVSAALAFNITICKDYRNFDEKRFIFVEIGEGLSFLKGQKHIVSILIIIAATHFFIGSLMVSLPFLAKGLEGNGIKNLGYLEMMMGVGLIGGSLFIGMKKKASINESKLILIILMLGFSFTSLSILQLFCVHGVFA